MANTTPFSLVIVDSTIPINTPYVDNGVLVAGAGGGTAVGGVGFCGSPFFPYYQKYVFVVQQKPEDPINMTDPITHESVQPSSVTAYDYGWTGEQVSWSGKIVSVTNTCDGDNHVTGTQTETSNSYGHIEDIDKVEGPFLYLHTTMTLGTEPQFTSEIVDVVPELPSPGPVGYFRTGDYLTNVLTGLISSKSDDYNVYSLAKLESDIVDWVGFVVGLQHADERDVRRIIWPQG